MKFNTILTVWSVAFIYYIYQVQGTQVTSDQSRIVVHPSPNTHPKPDKPASIIGNDKSEGLKDRICFFDNMTASTKIFYKSEMNISEKIAIQQSTYLIRDYIERNNLLVFLDMTDCKFVRNDSNRKYFIVYCSLRIKKSVVDTVSLEKEEDKELSTTLHQDRFRFSTIKVLQTVSSKQPYANVTVYIGSSEHDKVTPQLKRAAERYSLAYGSNYLQKITKTEFDGKYRITSCTFKSEKKTQSTSYIILSCALQGPSIRNKVYLSRMKNQLNELKVFQLQSIRISEVGEVVRLKLFKSTMKELSVTDVTDSLKQLAKKAAERYVSIELRKNGELFITGDRGCRFRGTREKRNAIVIKFACCKCTKARKRNSGSQPSRRDGNNLRL